MLLFPFLPDQMLYTTYKTAKIMAGTGMKNTKISLIKTNVKKFKEYLLRNSINS